MGSKDCKLLQTELYDSHKTLGAKLVPFAGWEMPLQYRGVFEEVVAVRTGSGMFDVSHMGRLEIYGPGCKEFLDSLITVDLEKLRDGHARYGFLLNENGGILDDLVAYSLDSEMDGQSRYYVICNAGTRYEVVKIFGERAVGNSSVIIEDQTEDTVMIAVQGPGSALALNQVFPGLSQVETIRYFGVERIRSAFPSSGEGEIMISRTGYTGEDGYELVCPRNWGTAIWENLLGAGVTPCGLASRDLLRLESGLRLYGVDMDVSTTPMEAGLAKFISWDKDFLGKDALKAELARGLSRCLVGFVMQGKAIPRNGYKILHGKKPIGWVTSGGHSPTLDTDIGMGYVSSDHSSPGTRVNVDVRGRPVEAELIKLPFYKR